MSSDAGSIVLKRPETVCPSADTGMAAIRRKSTDMVNPAKLAPPAALLAFCGSSLLEHYGFQMPDTLPSLKLTYEGAQKMLAAAVAKAKAMGVPQCIAIVDNGGNMLAFARMDGAKPLSGPSMG